MCKTFTKTKNSICLDSGFVDLENTGECATLTCVLVVHAFDDISIIKLVVIDSHAHKYSFHGTVCIA